MDREILALECVVAVLSGLITIWIGNGVGSNMPSTVAALVISLACLGLIHGSNPIRTSTSQAILAGSVAVYWLIALVFGAFVGWQRPALLFFLNPGNIVIYAGCFLWAFCVSLAARPITTISIRVFSGGDTPIARINKILRTLALTIVAIGAIWTALKKLLQ